MGRSESFGFRESVRGGWKVKMTGWKAEVTGNCSPAGCHRRCLGEPLGSAGDSLRETQE